MVTIAMSLRGFMTRHRIMGHYTSLPRYTQRLFLLGFFFLPLFHSLLRADITTSPIGTKGLSSERRGAISSTVLAKPVQGEVIRGGEADIRIDVVLPNSGDVSIQISRPPRFGSLQPLENRSASALIYRYMNDGTLISGEDSFEFRIRAPGQAWSTHTASIRIKTLPGVLSVIPEKVDFGKVPIGSTARRSILLCNNFGAPVSGTLLLPAPWSLIGDGAYTIAEKQTRSFEIQFKPTEAKAEISQLKTAPELTNFPTVPIIGEGIVPFTIDTTSAIITTEHSKAAFQITNSSESEITVNWTDDTGLLCSLPARIPARGKGEVWVSIGSLPLENEEKKVLHPSLRQGSFTLPLEIVVLGPKGVVSFVPTEESKTITQNGGTLMTLEGTLQSSSSTKRTVELKFSDTDAGAKAQAFSLPLSITIPPHGSLPQRLSLSVPKPGKHTLTLLITESGREICRASWKILVQSPEADKPVLPMITPSLPHESGLTSQVTQEPHSITRIASNQERETVVMDLKPSFAEGLVLRSLILHWRYYGSLQSSFVIQEQVHRNALTHREIELEGDDWRAIKTSHLRIIGDSWIATIPMPWPGVHSYRVFPDIPGPKIIAPVTLRISWGIYLWPSIRALLCIIFLICLIKVIRRRNWGRGERG